MASDKEYLQFLLEQLPAEVKARPMMGEFVLYYRGKVFGGIYDNRFLVKPVPAAVARMPMAVPELPYPGGKEMLLVDEVEDPEFLAALLAAMLPELPETPDKKKKHL